MLIWAYHGSKAKVIFLHHFQFFFREPRQILGWHESDKDLWKLESNPRPSVLELTTLTTWFQVKVGSEVFHFLFVGDTNE